MKFTIDTSDTRQVDDALSIIELFSGKGFRFDAVVAVLDGKHPLVRNNVSDRIYYFLDGRARVQVGTRTYDAASTDLIAIPAGTTHGLEGQARYLVITSPPFDPDNEDLIT